MSDRDATLNTSLSANESLPSADAVVDARGHRCPMPLLMAKRALNRLAPGQTLELLSTDAGSQRDFEVFARQSGHHLLEAREDTGEYSFLLRKQH